MQFVSETSITTKNKFGCERNMVIMENENNYVVADGYGCNPSDLRDFQVPFFDIGSFTIICFVLFTISFTLVKGSFVLFYP